MGPKPFSRELPLILASASTSQERQQHNHFCPSSCNSGHSLLLSVLLPGAMMTVSSCLACILEAVNQLSQKFIQEPCSIRRFRKMGGSQHGRNVCRPLTSAVGTLTSKPFFLETPSQVKVLLMSVESPT